MNMQQIYELADVEDMLWWEEYVEAEERAEQEALLSLEMGIDPTEDA